MTQTAGADGAGTEFDLEAVAALVAGIQSQPEKAKTSWRADVRWTGGLRSEARVRNFAPLPSDEPPALGGSNTAPNPVEQLLAALGNCLAVGYVANAKLLGIPVESLRVRLEGDIDLRTFLGLTPGGHAGYEAIRVVVELKSTAPREQVQALHERVVGSSPVGHSLSRAVPLQIELRDGVS